jgi:hypothetical protein
MKQKMKKSIILYSAVAAFILAFGFACKESFLEITPQGRLAGSTLANEFGTEGALIGAYAMLDGYNIDNNNTWPADPVNWIMGSVTSDDAYKGSEQGDGPEMTELEIYQWSAANVLLNQRWVPLYEGVTRANKTLQLLAEATDISDANRARIEGECKFLRAYFHSQLYLSWGNIPYILETDTDLKKSNVGGDPLGNIISDFQTAVNLLPDVQSDAGRADKAAAQAMLGKFLVHKGDWAAAKAALDPVVAGTALADCQRELFHYDTENHESALFSVQMSISSDAQARNSNFLNQLANPQSDGFGCCGFHQPSQNLVNAYKVDGNGLPMLDTFNDADLDPGTDTVDPRLDLTVGRDDVPYLDWGTHNPNYIRARGYSGPYSPKKMQPFKAADAAGRPGGGWNGPSNSGTNVPLIRLADAILLLAEAEVELGNLPVAEALVNRVRARAGNCTQGPLVDGGGFDAVITYDINDAGITWANYDVQEYSGQFASNGADYARKAVRMERRLELAMEGHRFSDLQRWGIAETVLNDYIAVEQTKRTYLAEAATYTDRHRWYPIPTTQVELSKVEGEPTLVQNPGW